MKQAKISQNLLLVYIVQIVSLALATCTALLSWMSLIAVSAVNISAPDNRTQMQIDDLGNMQVASERLASVSIALFVVALVATLASYAATKKSNKYAGLIVFSASVFSLAVIISLLLSNTIVLRFILG